MGVGKQDGEERVSYLTSKLLTRVFLSLSILGILLGQVNYERIHTQQELGKEKIIRLCFVGLVGYILCLK